MNEAEIKSLISSFENTIKDKEFIKSNDGKIIDATALAEWYYLLKKGILDKISQNMPYSIIMISPETYEYVGGKNTQTSTKINIAGFSTYPDNPLQKYYIAVYIEVTKGVLTNVHRAPITIKDHKFSYEFSFTDAEDSIATDDKYFIKVEVEDPNNPGQYIQVSDNIGTITRYFPIRGIIYGTDTKILNLFPKSKEYTASTSLKGTYVLEQPEGSIITSNKTMFLFIPEVIEAPTKFYLSNGGFFETKAKTDPLNYTIVAEGVTYNLYKYSVNIKSSITSEPVTIL